MTPEQMAALDAVITTFDRAEKYVPAMAPAVPAAPSVQLYVQTADQPDDWCELRLETKAGKIRMTWKSADGDIRDSEWRLRERSNTQLALFVGFLKSFVAKSFGRVPVLKPENIAPLDKPGEPA